MATKALTRRQVLAMRADTMRRLRYLKNRAADRRLPWSIRYAAAVYTDSAIEALDEIDRLLQRYEG